MQKKKEKKKKKKKKKRKKKKKKKKKNNAANCRDNSTSVRVKEGETLQSEEEESDIHRENIFPADKRIRAKREKLTCGGSFWAWIL